MRYALRKWEQPWTLTNDFDGFSRELDHLWESVLSPTKVEWSSEGPFTPAVDVQETKTHYVISLDVPGLERSDIQVEVKDNELVISGERKSEVREGEKNKRYVERRYGKFHRRFALPENVDTAKVEAAHKNGVLQIALPKMEPKKAKVIAIREDKEGFLNRILGKKSEKETKEVH